MRAKSLLSIRLPISKKPPPANRPGTSASGQPLAKDWRQLVEKHAGAAISDLVEMPETHHFKLNLEKAEDFDDLFRNLTGAGHVLREITPVKATLEDVFLKLTSAEERKEAA